MYVIYVYCNEVFFIKVSYFTVFFPHHCLLHCLSSFFIIKKFFFKISVMFQTLEEGVEMIQVTCSVVYATPVAGWLVAQDSRTIIESCNSFQDFTTLEELVNGV